MEPGAAGSEAAGGAVCGRAQGLMARLMARLRRMFARARLETEEVNILRGILRALDERVRGR